MENAPKREPIIQSTIIIYQLPIAHKTMAEPGQRTTKWCTTVNNYTDDTIHYIKTEGHNWCKYIIVGIEKGENGTPHLQCFVETKTNMRRDLMQKRVFDTSAMHSEFKSKNSTEHQAAEYCKKEGNWFEFGTPPKPDKKTMQGERNDLNTFKEYVKNDKGNSTFAEYRELFSQIASKYGPFFRNYINDVRTQFIPKTYGIPRKWQIALKDLMDHYKNDREIIFVVCPKGNTGKSWFANWYWSHNPTRVQIMEPGKKADMAYELCGTKPVVILDCPRSKQGDFIQYDFLEAVKNKRVFSPKYEATTKTFTETTTMVVLMNEPPDYTKLSVDRYHYFYPEEWDDYEEKRREKIIKEYLFHQENTKARNQNLEKEDAIFMESETAILEKCKNEIAQETEITITTTEVARMPENTAESDIEEWTDEPPTKKPRGTKTTGLEDTQNDEEFCEVLEKFIDEDRKRDMGWKPTTEETFEEMIARLQSKHSVNPNLNKTRDV